MHVIFVEPGFPFNQREFVRGLHAAGAKVSCIGERPVESLDDALKGWMVHYEQVRSVVHEPSLLEAVRRIQKLGWVDRLEATVEAHITPAAKVREVCGIPGTSVQTAFLCRDKPAMKEALRQAGVPCAASTGATSAAEVIAFVEREGFPVIIKPAAGAGAAGTFRCDTKEQLQRAIQESQVDHGAEVAVEEFIEGHEGFYDTISVNGQVAHEFICHYYPNVLEGMRQRWISPQIISTNRVDSPSYDEVKTLGSKVIRALGIGTSATHMEWFYGPKGLKFSEIGCRPPGVGAWDLYCAGNDLDLYEEWGHALVAGGAKNQASRRFSSGMIALRPNQDGRVVGYEGVDELHADWAEHLIDTHFPAVGSGTQPVEGGFMANAWVRMRHPDYDTLHKMLDTVGERVQMYAQ
ncbi:MAG: carboxylate--amine ligase [Planctomycetota bacterium]|nr:MAG: carboxylate--amine ligase [Planctomycetota bacterium]